VRVGAGSGAAALLFLAAFATPPAATAADRLVSLQIGPERLDRALIELARQAGLSIADRSGPVCGAKVVALRGRYTLSQAMDRLLKNSGCTYRFADAVAVIVLPPAPSGAKKPVTGPPPPVNPESAEVTVVATRQPAPIAQSPYSVTKVEGATLAALDITDSNGLAPLVAGMTVTNLGAGRDKIFLRGLSDGVLTGRTQSTVGLYLDDVAVGYDAPDPDLRLVDIASVEVLRGPQGAIYGSGSIAGIVQYRSRQPELGSFAAEASAEVSATEGGALGSSFEGMVNLPLLKDRLGLRVVGYQDVIGGYIDDASLGRGDVNQTRRSGVRAIAVLKLDDGWTLRAGGAAQSIDSADSQYTTGGLPAYQRAVNIAEPHDNDFSEVYATIARRGSSLEFKSTTALIQHQLDTRYDATDSLPLLAPGVAGIAAFDDGTRKHLLTEDMTLATVGDRWFQWLAGAYYLRDNETDRSRLSSVSSPGLGALYDELRSDLQEGYAIYGEGTLQLTSRLYLTVGARLFRNDIQVASRISASDGERAVDVGEHERGLAPKAVIRYDLDPHLLVYFQANEGYRGGGVNTSGLASQVFSTTAGGPQPGQFYRGDELWNYETGIKTSGWNGALEAHLAAFYDSWSRVQSDQLLPSGLSYTANVGSALNKGLEIELALRPAAGLEFRSDLTINDPQLITRDPGFASVRDALLPGISRVSGGGGVFYTGGLPFGLVGEAALQASYVGRSEISLNPASASTTGGYIASRAAVGLRYDRWRLQLMVQNLANQAENTFAYGNPFSQRFTAQATPERPRTATLRLSAAF